MAPQIYPLSLLLPLYLQTLGGHVERSLFPLQPPGKFQSRRLYLPFKLSAPMSSPISLCPEVPCLSLGCQRSGECHQGLWQNWTPQTRTPHCDRTAPVGGTRIACPQPSSHCVKLLPKEAASPFHSGHQVVRLEAVTQGHLATLFPLSLEPFQTVS